MTRFALLYSAFLAFKVMRIQIKIMKNILLELVSNFGYLRLNYTASKVTKITMLSPVLCQYPLEITDESDF